MLIDSSCSMLSPVVVSCAHHSVRLIVVGAYTYYNTPVTLPIEARLCNPYPGDAALFFKLCLECEGDVEVDVCGYARAM